MVLWTDEAARCIVGKYHLARRRTMQVHCPCCSMDGMKGKGTNAQYHEQHQCRSYYLRSHNTIKIQVNSNQAVRLGGCKSIVAAFGMDDGFRATYLWWNWYVLETRRSRSEFSRMPFILSRFILKNGFSRADRHVWPVALAILSKYNLPTCTTWVCIVLVFFLSS